MDDVTRMLQQTLSEPVAAGSSTQSKGNHVSDHDRQQSIQEDSIPKAKEASGKQNIQEDSIPKAKEASGTTKSILPIHNETTKQTLEPTDISPSTISVPTKDEDVPKPPPLQIRKQSTDSASLFHSRQASLGATLTFEETKHRKRYSHTPHSKSLSAYAPRHRATLPRFEDFVFPGPSTGENGENFTRSSAVEPPTRGIRFWTLSHDYDQRFERHINDPTLPTATSELFTIAKALLATVSASLFPVHLPLVHPVGEEELKFCRETLEDILAGFNDYYQHLENRRFQIEAVYYDLNVEHLKDPENAEMQFLALRHRVRTVNPITSAEHGLTLLVCEIFNLEIYGTFLRKRRFLPDHSCTSLKDVVYALWERLVCCLVVADCMARLLDSVAYRLRQFARATTSSVEMATRRVVLHRQLNEVIRLSGHGDTVRPMRSFDRHGLRARQNTV